MFHLVIHPRPTSAEEQARVQLGTRPVTTLSITPGQLTDRFALSFEEVAQRLTELPRMFLEPDGSFVWVVDDFDRQYQLDGSLYDDGVRLLHVELKGTCDSTALDTFLSRLGWPTQTLIFQLVQQGIYLSEGEFRRFAFGNL